MNLSGAVQWWDEWQLRVLVLGSLFIQFFLFFSSSTSRFAIPSWFRVSIWLAYLGADALAIYALATLFNRHKQPTTAAADGSSGGSVLEVLWAPVLLIHIGGHHLMTAYSIEDNEMWGRHVVTVVSQVTVALFVFCKSWSGEKRLLQAAILLFVVGILRIIEKPLALRSASIDSVITSASLPRREPGVAASCWEYCTGYQLAPHLVSDHSREEEEAEEKDLPLEEYVQAARVQVSHSHPPASDQEQEEEYRRLLKRLLIIDYRLLVDISAPYSTRLKTLHSLIALDERRTYILSSLLLDAIFGRFYTKLPPLTVTACCLHVPFLFLTLASVVLFSTSHKYFDYDARDIKVTYILFCCTVVLDFLSPLLGYRIAFIGSDKVSQHSLMSVCARKKRPTTLMKLAAAVCFKDYVNTHWYIDCAPASPFEITVLASYKRFNSHRGQCTLRKRRLAARLALGWSLKIAFDKSVLLWHIATGLCFHHQSTTPRSHECAAQSMVISNYMAYLLFIRPEMLMPGTRSSIFTLACDDVELMLVGEPALDERGLAQGILRSWAQQPSSRDAGSRIGTLVPNACRLAEELMMRVDDEQERWKVVEGVWMEILCYSASRCKGYLHAKNMGEGVELVSYVWILLSLMGMEAFGDRFQKPEPPEPKEEEEEGDEEESVYQIGSGGRAIEDEIATCV